MFFEIYWCIKIESTVFVNTSISNTVPGFGGSLILFMSFERRYFFLSGLHSKSNLKSNNCMRYDKWKVYILPLFNCFSDEKVENNSALEHFRETKACGELTNVLNFGLTRNKLVVLTFSIYTSLIKEK